MIEDNKEVHDYTYSPHLEVAGDQFILIVLGADNGVVFKVNKSTPLRELMHAYCEYAGLEITAVRFRFDGEPINENDTPISLEMRQCDIIEVYEQQTGGRN